MVKDKELAKSLGLVVNRQYTSKFQGLREHEEKWKQFKQRATDPADKRWAMSKIEEINKAKQQTRVDRLYKDHRLEQNKVYARTIKPSNVEDYMIRWEMFTNDARRKRLYNEVTWGERNHMDLMIKYGEFRRQGKL